MKRISLVFGFLFVSANVFGMYNNETNCSGSTNPKRPIPYDQEFIPCKKHITSVGAFEKSSADKLKRRNSDDMEVDRDGREGRVNKENPTKIEPCIIDAIIPGYLHILRECHPNMSTEELRSLDATLAGSFDRIKDLLTYRGLPHKSDATFVVNIAIYSTIKNPRINMMYAYTRAISKLLFLDDEQRHMINDSLTILERGSVIYSDDMINSLIRACFEWIVMSGLYEVKH